MSLAGHGSRDPDLTLQVVAAALLVYARSGEDRYRDDTIEYVTGSRSFASWRDRSVASATPDTSSQTPGGTIGRDAENPRSPAVAGDAARAGGKNAPASAWMSDSRWTARAALVGLLAYGLRCLASGGTQMAPKITILDLFTAVSEYARSDAEIVATVAYMVNSGRVRLGGNFRGACFDLESPGASMAADAKAA